MEPRILVTIIIQTVLILLSVLIMTKIIVRVRRTSVFWSYIIIQTNLLIWLVGVFMGSVAPTKHLYDFYIMVQFTSLLILPFGWLLFCKSFRDGVFLSKTHAYSLFIGTGFLVVLILTNSFHGLLIQEIYRDKLELGILFWFIIGLLSLEFFMGLWLLLKRTRPMGRKKGTYWLAISGLSGFGIALLSINSDYAYHLYLLGILPIGMFFGFIQYTWKDSFVDLSAGAFDVFISSIQETILIFDQQGKLSEFNSMSLHPELQFEGLSTFVDFKKKIMEHWASGNLEIFETINGAGGKIIQEEFGLKIGNNQQVNYIISLTHLDQENDTMGMVITLRDISLEKELERDLAHKNMKLEQISSKLHDYIAIAHQLEEEKERNQIAMNINSMIGQNIVEILTILEGLQHSLDDDKIKVGDNLGAVIDRCRLVLDRIREAVAELMPIKN